MPVLLYVYRLRYRGERQDRAAMGREGIPGDLRLEAFEAGWRGRRQSMAYLFKPGTRDELLPRLEGARIVRVREALLIAGTEQIPRGRKSVERYRQAWVCAVQEIALHRWPELRMRESPQPATGFDPADDDCAL
ncbi:hypothetical protein LZ009_05070 [Ramlibacter sp. XY19]|uniref:hypothetical protein n=1 Tax=Ramlibacter paludis TaxID=2908000 RepID=UPI0023DCCA0B|nr:hypothetical protein [Ramlibacter paludis]MCG2592147.1 hypothetical protein [Ramlibacter paludis]